MKQLMVHVRAESGCNSLWLKWIWAQSLCLTLPCPACNTLENGPWMSLQATNLIKAAGPIWWLVWSWISLQPCRDKQWATQHSKVLDTIYSGHQSPQFSCVQHSSVLLMRVVRQQLHGNHKCSKLFVPDIFLACIVSFQITKPGNVESI